jgi:hypothetical protein
MREQKYNQGFRKGYGQLQVKDVKSFQQEVWKILEINNRNSFSQYKLGKIEPKANQAVAIEATFARYGVTKDIWGK